ncbi:hypothetical protein EDC14_101170 [Hydrogenispora ethanolica]|uniref:Uncharacterized protein n=1 Tax=Hydrogenispora ethanolica TaxID=1082276 RepID=A0A4R1RTS7_HYDET|nr:hypothetical protein [Hydrogenispora ethanolica]TCL69948.1 hypothetical protein EDC14_101170 [Hydrogenispora ethanolica]
MVLPLNFNFAFFAQLATAPTILQFLDSVIMPYGTADRQLYFRLTCSALTTVSFGFTRTEL